MAEDANVAFDKDLVEKIRVKAADLENDINTAIRAGLTVNVTVVPVKAYAYSEPGPTQSITIEVAISRIY
jgi:hypothetical protein